jgi:hypothetical protein
MEPDVRGAIAQQLVIPLRSVVEPVGTFDVIEEQGSGSFRGRRNQVIEIDVFKPIVGPKPHDVALVPDDIIEFVLPVQTGDRRITLALFHPRLDRNANVALRSEIEAHEGVADKLWSQAQATPISKTKVTTPKRNKRTEKRHTWMTRDFEGGEECRFLLRDMWRQADSEIMLREGRLRLTR